MRWYFRAVLLLIAGKKSKQTNSRFSMYSSQHSYQEMCSDLKKKQTKVTKKKQTYILSASCFSVDEMMYLDDDNFDDSFKCISHVFQWSLILW